MRSLSPSGRSQARELGRAQCCTTTLRPPAHCITARTLQKLQEAVEAVEGRLRLGVDARAGMRRISVIDVMSHVHKTEDEERVALRYQVRRA